MGVHGSYNTSPEYPGVSGRCPRAFQFQVDDERKNLGYSTMFMENIIIKDTFKESKW